MRCYCNELLGGIESVQLTIEDLWDCKFSSTSWCCGCYTNRIQFSNEFSPSALDELICIFLFPWKKINRLDMQDLVLSAKNATLIPHAFWTSRHIFFAWRLFPQVCMPRQGYQLTVFESTSLLKFLCSIFLLNSFVSIFPPEWVAQISLKGGLNHIKDNDKSTKCATRYNIIFDNQ